MSGRADTAVGGHGSALHRGTRVRTQWTRAEGGDDQWYQGVVQDVYGNGQVTIRYDDGDEWTGSSSEVFTAGFAAPVFPSAAATAGFAAPVFPSAPVGPSSTVTGRDGATLTEGARVHTYLPEEGRFFSGYITQVFTISETVSIRYDDGDAWMGPANEVSSGPAPEPTQVLASGGRVLSQGDRVFTRLTEEEGGHGEIYSGRVAQIYLASQTVTVQYDDGDTWTGPASEVFPADVPMQQQALYAGPAPEVFAGGVPLEQRQQQQQEFFGPQAGDFVIADGRRGRVIQVSPQTASCSFTHKVEFSDGLLPQADWFEGHTLVRS